MPVVCTLRSIKALLARCESGLVLRPERRSPCFQLFHVSHFLRKPLDHFRRPIRISKSWSRIGFDPRYFRTEQILCVQQSPAFSPHKLNRYEVLWKVYTLCRQSFASSSIRVVQLDGTIGPARPAGGKEIADVPASRLILVAIRHKQIIPFATACGFIHDVLHGVGGRPGSYSGSRDRPDKMPISKTSKK